MTSMEKDRLYDLIIIGAGPGGYIAAERAGSKGKKVLLVEKADLGGVCLNAGCIPSKTLINSGKLFAQACNSDVYGVTVENPRFDLTKAMAYKQRVIKTLRNGVGFQMKQRQVDILTGDASFIDQRTVQVNGDKYQAENVIVATGASPVLPPISGLDEAHVVTSKEILEVDKLPDHLVVIGGGAIGCEFASFFSNVGVQVSLIEVLPEIIFPLDNELAGMLRKSIKGVNFHLESKVERITANSVVYSQNGESKNISCDMVLVSVGRKPNVEGLGLENIDIDFDQHGIKVNQAMQTNVPHIYAVGDVTGTSMLAHSASRMGEVAVRNMSGEQDTMRYHAIPWVVYSNPEAAWVGMTEAEAKDKGIPVKTAKLPMNANGRFLVENSGKRGICKVVVDAQTDLLLGVQMVGATCSEIIYGAAAMIEDEFRVQDIKDVIFPHPTVSEILKDTLYYLPA